MMKAISLWQPWATLIALEEKLIETRGRRINHRGELAIHAAQRWQIDQSSLLSVEPFRARLAYHGITADNVVHDLMPRGAIVAVVDLVDDIALTPMLFASLMRDEGALHEHAFGNYGAGRRGYLLKNIRKLPRPVLCRGMQAMPFELPSDVEALVREQLRSAA